MRTSSTLVALSSLLAFASATPIAKRQTTHPYFSVTNFSFSKTDTSARYELNLSFPEDVSVSNVPADQPVYVVPGFKDAVACTGTFFFSGEDDSDSAHITPINACGQSSDPNKSVTTKLDVVTGELFLTYTLKTTPSGGQDQLFTYGGSQKGLSPVDPANAESFNTPATTGKGIDS